ncbi:MAG: ribose-phosphate pyrophosphokinase [Candidatus Eisenbacteria bacterium]|uniref:Ribose-phosphate pyrophosphokinase n=1 Tax=Eiseniibacteriota bacterium TaxID=2212470 RepID=A0A538T7M2_UNCEI|nr:MAG: ribose-phosphate pyrophosphokinase [Candidatus Eisenbacteria bacterium]
MTVKLATDRRLATAPGHEPESPRKRAAETRLRLFTGNANRPLAEAICEYLGTELGDATVDQFSDGETFVKINENIRGSDIFVFQPTFAPAKNLMELLVMIDAARRASAGRVTAVIPYFGYQRQDRKDQPRVPITAKLVANLITTAGADRVMTMDLHSAQIQGFFDIPFDHLYAAPVLVDYYLRLNIPNLIAVAPDIGSVKMARAYAKRLGVGLAVVDKRRPRPDAVEMMNVIGEVEGKNVVIFDDVVSTGATLVEAAEALKRAGARDIYAACTHAVLCGDAVEQIRRSSVRELIVTDSIPHDAILLAPKIKMLSVAGLLGEAIRRIHDEESLSSLFI